MSKNKINPLEKLLTIHLILEGKESQNHAADRLGISLSSIQQWISIYVIVVEKKTPSTEKENAALSEDQLLVCKRQLDASNLRYFLDIRGSVIYCILNYSREIYSIRAFVGQFRQVIWNIDTSQHICVYYSEALVDHNEIFDELFYMLGQTDYGLFWGRSRTITSAFMHSNRSGKRSVW